MSRSRVEFDEREFIREQPRRAVAREYDDVEVRVRERSRERVNDRLPHFLREDNRRAEPGQLVLRQREIETVERPRPRSPSPVHVTQRIIQRARSVSPPRREEDVRFRRVVRESSRGPVERIRVVPPRSRSPSPEVRDRIRIIEREKERAPSPAPPRPPTPKVIKGPTIEREVITHYRDIDHGKFYPFNTFSGGPSLTPCRSRGGSSSSLASSRSS